MLPLYVQQFDPCKDVQRILALEIHPPAQICPANVLMLNDKPLDSGSTDDPVSPDLVADVFPGWHLATIPGAS